MLQSAPRNVKPSGRCAIRHPARGAHSACRAGPDGAVRRDEAWQVLMVMSSLRLRFVCVPVVLALVAAVSCSREKAPGSQVAPATGGVGTAALNSPIQSAPRGSSIVTPKNPSSSVMSPNPLGKPSPSATKAPDAQLSPKSTVDPAKIAMALYPGAVQRAGAEVSAARGKIISMTLATEASFEKVAAFYKAKYPKAKMRSAANEAQKTLTLEVNPAPALKTVTIVSKQGESMTLITLVRYQPAKGQAAPATAVSTSPRSASNPVKGKQKQ